MKIKLTTRFIVNAVIALVILFIASEFLVVTGSVVTSGTSTTDGIITEINNLKPIDEVIPDSIPHSKYKILQDSVTTLRKLKNGDMFTASSNNGFGLFMTYSSHYCDSCTVTFHKGSVPSFYDPKLPERYYIKLTGWKLKQTWFPDSVRFYVEHGQSYLRKLLVDSIHKSKNGTIEKIAYYHDQKVLFKYNHDSNCIMIPIKKSTHDVLGNILLVCGLLSIAYYLFFVVGGFFKFLIDVYQGQTFTSKNVRRLKIIALSLIIFPVMMFLISLCMPLIFHDYFTPDIELSKNSWSDSWQSVATGIAFLLLYKAFLNGKKIKEEQDLVI